ncbi:MAG: hypothetical protein KDD41_03985 [Flavobacteriales bacterium]|nr:hypothetical protein [Flavobacteriales bacterium]
MKKKIFVLLFLLSACIAQAGVSTYRAKYTGLQLNGGAPALKVEDDFFQTMLMNPNWSQDFVNVSVKNRIRLVYINGDKEHDVNTLDWPATVTFDVEVRDENNTIISTLNNQSLTISNTAQAVADPTTNNESVMELLTAGYKMTLRNFSFSGFPSNSRDFELIAEIETERYFNLDFYTSFIYNFNYGHTELDLTSSVCTNPNPALTTWDNKIRVFWEYVHGAEEYELEWYFNSSENADQYSQIILAGPNPLPSTIPAREWTRITTTFDDYQISLPYDEGILFYRVRPVGRFLSDPTANYYGEWSPIGEYQVLNDEPNKNWQYSATYAEEGKVKEVVSFFDGSGRNRQAVTRSSTEDISLITETMYDYEGRPVIQTLPAPNVARSQNLGFHCDYTLNNGNLLLSKADYDYFPGCDLNAPKLGTSEGASNYYSPNNPEKNIGENQVIPDAEQYPYTQSVFGRDGRIKYQSAPGAKHNITDNGTITDNRFTKFFYATPLQYKLDRLFGNEVGYASHYKVKAVEDANGQVSLSYLDLSDNVVATSLVGASPANLQALPSNTGPAQVQADFNNLNNYQSNTESYVINSKFLVEVEGPHQFNYSLTPEIVTTLCGSPDYGCVYDLEITIYDDCDRKIYDSGINTSGDPYDAAYNTVLLTQYITINTSITTTGNFIVNFNKVGTYSIKKELKLNQAALDAAVYDFTKYHASNCFDPYNMPINTENCDDCETFCTNNPTLCDPNECGSANVGLSCDFLHDQLVADMSPGGQYFDNLSGVTSGIDTWLELYVVPSVGGVFDPGSDPSVDAKWAAMGFPHPNTSIPYIDNWTDMRTYWDPSWATMNFTQITTFFGNDITSLVQAHPEYCHYELCLTLEPSAQFDQDFSSSNTLPTTFTALLGSTSYSSGSLNTFLGDMVNADPFFTTLGTGYSTLNMLNGPYTNVNTGGQGLQADIEDIIIASGQTVTTLDDAWPYIRQAYVERKHIWVKAYKESQDCYYLLDYKDASGTIGNFDNLAETFLQPVPGLLPAFVLNADAYVYYQNDPFGPQPPNSSSEPFGLFYASVVLHQSIGIFPYTEVDLHNFYFSGFQIREPDYLDFFYNGIGQPGFPSSMPAFGAQFGNNIPATYCGQLVSCTDFTSCDFSNPFDGWTNIPTTLSSPIFSPVPSSPYNYVDMPLFLSSGDVSALGNELISPLVAGKTYTFTADIKTNIASSDFSFKIAYTNNLGFNSTIGAGYGPTDPNAVTLLVAQNVMNTNWMPVSYSFTVPTSSSFSHLIMYVDDILAVDNGLQIRNVMINEVCEPINFNCYCTQLADAEALFIQENPGATTTDFANDLAGFYATQFPSLGVTAADIQEWITNCQTDNDPNQNPYNNPVPEEINCPTEDPCLEQSMNIAGYYNSLFNQQALDSAVNYFIDHYKASCFGGNFAEDFNVSYEDREYHFTLYYYDRAGNLTRTVAPQGVNMLNATATQDVDNYRTGNAPSPTYPVHQFVTRYQYNTLNQLTQQNTPDAGPTAFFYDAIGRLKASQNAKQAALNPKRYSYTVYDAQGRITEVGELISNVPPTSTQLDDPAFPASWIGVADRYQVTYTQYDVTLNSTINNLFGAAGQENLRSRVASSYTKSISSNTTWQFANHYSYDIHGNVKMMIADYPPLATFNQQYKTLEYEYDLISGNVNKVSFQKGKADQYHHKYCYDADNRIIEAYTSKDNLIWENDADYFYNLHGPLARTEIGEEKVQGQDYAYTIHGWLKGVNSNNIVSNLEGDIGKDGLPGALYAFYPTVNDVHDNLARDAYGFSLSYYEDAVDDDYKAISANGNNFLTDINNLNIQPDNLFNGNIRQMATSLMNEIEVLLPVQATNYGYDQLNRLKGMMAYSGDVSYALANTNQYNTLYTYDANGNLLNLNRKATNNAGMDNLDYAYYSGPSGPTNKLSYVNDIDPANTQTTGVPGYLNAGFNDISAGQLAGNYKYDEIGNLITDDAEEIGLISWNVYGKILRIRRSAGSTRPDLAFRYDPNGNRVTKVVAPAGTNENDWDFYHYYRDASGNTMAVYHQYFTPAGTNLWTSHFELVENPIYGSSRIGTDNRDLEFQTVFAAQIGTGGTFEYITAPVSYPGGLQAATVQTGGSVTVGTGGSNIGFTLYSNNAVTINGGPFTNVSGAANVGADFIDIPANGVVTFNTAADMTLITSANTDVEIAADLNFTLQGQNQISIHDQLIKLSTKYHNYRGNKTYELTNHLGNVLATVSDRKRSEDPGADNLSDYFLADVKSYSDYYPFGQPMPNRYSGGSDYRYGFQGQEQDKEVKNGRDLSVNFKYRVHDPRLGRFMSIDPLASKFPYMTPYQFAGNKPIWSREIEGLESAVDARKNTNTYGFPERKEPFHGAFNFQHGFSTSGNAKTASLNGGITGSGVESYKHFWVPGATLNDGSKGAVFFQAPYQVQTNTPGNGQFVPNTPFLPQTPGAPLTSNFSFIRNQVRGLTPAQTNALVAGIPPQGVQPVTPNGTAVVTGSTVTTATNSEGLPTITTTTTTTQPAIRVNNATTVTVTLQTGYPNAAVIANNATGQTAGNVLTTRINLIRAQLVRQGVNAANIIFNPVIWNVANLPNGNTVNVVANTNVTQQSGNINATQITTNSYTYGQ